MYSRLMDPIAVTWVTYSVSLRHDPSRPWKALAPEVADGPSADAAAHFLGGVAAEFGHRGLEAVGAQ
jgi:hypothetical protein